MFTLKIAKWKKIPIIPQRAPLELYVESCSELLSEHLQLYSVEVANINGVLGLFSLILNN